MLKLTISYKLRMNEIIKFIQYTSCRNYAAYVQYASSKNGKLLTGNV